MPWEPDRKKRLAAADRVLEESVDSIACELRPALRSVLKLARQIREFDGTPDSDTREYADYVRASAEHMSVMIGRLRRQPHAVRPGRDGC